MLKDLQSARIDKSPLGLWPVDGRFDGQLWTCTIVELLKWLIIVAAGDIFILVPLSLPPAQTTTTKPAP